MEALLWQSTTRPTRFFLIPLETQVYTGGFEIENSDGEKYSVELDEIINFEISKEQADQIMSKKLESILSDFGSILGSMVNLGLEESSEDDSDDDDSEFDSDEISEA